MQKENKPLGVVIAGGQSRRMTQDKALLKHPKGGSFLDFTLALFDQIGLELVVSGPFRPGFAKKVTFVEDQPQAQGPVGALYSVMRAHPGRSLLVLPVDMPSLDVETLSLILSKPLKENILCRVFAHASTVVGQKGTTFYPFPLLLRHDAASKVVDAVEQVRWSLMALIEELNPEKWDLPLGWQAQMANVNTPEGLRTFYDTPRR